MVLAWHKLSLILLLIIEQVIEPFPAISAWVEIVDESD